MRRCSCNPLTESILSISRMQSWSNFIFNQAASSIPHGWLVLPFHLMGILNESLNFSRPLNLEKDLILVMKFSSPVKSSKLLTVLDLSFSPSQLGAALGRESCSRWALLFHKSQTPGPYALRSRIHILISLISLKHLSPEEEGTCVPQRNKSFLNSSLQGHNHSYWPNLF